MASNGSRTLRTRRSSNGPPSGSSSSSSAPFAPQPSIPTILRRKRREDLGHLESSPVTSREPRSTFARKRKCPLPKSSSDRDQEELEIITIEDTSNSSENSDEASSGPRRRQRAALVCSNGRAVDREAKGEKKGVLNTQFRTLSIGFPTPLLAGLSNRMSPLPNFSWADAREVWELMLHKDELYTRNALLLHRHPTLQAKMRSILLDWLSEVCEVYNLHRETFYLGVDFIDRYLSSQAEIPKQQLQLIGITCLFIGSKIEEIYPPKLSEFAYVTDGACLEEDIITKELVILKALNWDLCPMTVNSWLCVYLQLYATLEKENTASLCQMGEESGDTFMIPGYSSYFFAQIAHLLDLSMLDVDSLRFSYSLIAAAALYHFTNEKVVNKCTGLSVDEIRECVLWMTPFALAIRDDGFESPKFQKTVDATETLPNIQSHTVDLKLLEKAHLKQCQLNSANSAEEPGSSGSLLGSPLSSPVASHTLMTPPRSGTKQK